MSKAWQKVSYTDLRLNEIFWPHHQNRCFCWYWLSKISLNEVLVFLFNWFLLLCDVLQILNCNKMFWMSLISTHWQFAVLREKRLRESGTAPSSPKSAFPPPFPWLSCICTNSTSVHSLLLICNPLPLQLVICKYFGCVIEYFHPREKRALVIV